MAASFCSGLGVILLIIGALGSVIGAHDIELFLGLNGNHNVIHMLPGALALVAGGLGERCARVCCVVLGSFYGMLALAGFAGSTFVASLLHLNHADDLLHLTIALMSLTIARQSEHAVQGDSPWPRSLDVAADHGHARRF